MGFVPLAWIGPGDQAVVAMVAACIGIGHGAGRVFSMSMLAGAADEDTARSVEAKEGVYFATSTFIEKGASGLAAFAVGLSLQGSGFEAGAAAQPDATLGVLRVLASFVPARLLGLSCALLWTRDPARATPQTPNSPSAAQSAV